MAQYDGTLETTNIIARAKTLAGGRVFDGIPDDTAMPVNPDGSVKPFLAVLTSDPVPTARDRGLGKEKSQPHIMAVSIACVASNGTDARNLAAAVTDLFLEWNPSDTADQMIAAGGYSLPQNETGYVPSRIFRMRRFTVVLNL
jgi:hypothetical protein